MEEFENMKKTKIVCTMGPNTNDKNIMLELAKNGMDVARFNFSTVIMQSIRAAWRF